MDTRGRGFAIIALCTILTAPGQAAAQDTQTSAFAAHLSNQYQVLPNVTYHVASNRDSTLDLYLPQNVRGSVPVLVYIHGGGWTGGAKEANVLRLLPYLERGWAVVNVGYRLGQVAPAPAAVEDCLCALRWVVDNADEYNFDTARIVTTGHSAGGHLALTTGMIPPSAGLDRTCPGDEPIQVAAIINWYGITDVADLLDGPNMQSGAVRWLGALPNRLEIAERVSPLTYVRGGLPPILTIHGEADPLVPHTHAVQLKERLDAVGVPNQLHTVPGGGHGRFNLDQTLAVFRTIDHFLGQHGLTGRSSTSQEHAAQCEADGAVQFVCGPVSPEDLILIPQSPWVIVSSMEDDGYLSATDSRDYSSTVVFPAATSRARHDTATYGSCPGVATDQFRPQGINLRPGRDGVHTLYVVRHGVRESVEVFEVDASGQTPTLTWVGCAVAPDALSLNAVVPLPDGGFAATSPRTRDVWEWHTETGWTRVPGSEDIGPNGGLEISPDGQWFYVAGYGSQSVIRLSRGQTPARKETVEVGFNVDNVHSAPDGTIFAAGHSAPTPTRVRECTREGQCDGIVSHVAKVDMYRRASVEVFTYPSNQYLILGTAAIQVGDELWVSGVAGGERIARVPAP